MGPVWPVSNCDVIQKPWGLSDHIETRILTSCGKTTVASQTSRGCHSCKAQEIILLKLLHDWIVTRVARAQKVFYILIKSITLEQFFGYSFAFNTLGNSDSDCCKSYERCHCFPFACAACRFPSWSQLEKLPTPMHCFTAAKQVWKHKLGWF